MPRASPVFLALAAACRLTQGLRCGRGAGSLAHRTLTSMSLSSPAATLVLHDGTTHPLVGYGTYKVGYVPPSASSSATGSSPLAAGESKSAADCVRQALEVGYTFLDCAEFYGNEAEVGAGIAASGVPRDKLFLASKVWTTTVHGGPEAVRKQVLRSIEDLGCGYLDLCCIHWPVPGKHVAAYEELQRLQQEGLIVSLGLSNYAIEDYQELMGSSNVNIKPTVNQIEINPFLYRKQTIDYFMDQGVQLQSYRALRDGKAFQHPVVAAIAARRGKTPAQVLGRWCVQNGFIYIPKSVQVDRMVENAQVLDWELTAEDMADLSGLTTEENLETFKALYIKCVLRDTPLEGTPEGSRLIKEITVL